MDCEAGRKERKGTRQNREKSLKEKWQRYPGRSGEALKWHAKAVKRAM